MKAFNVVVKVLVALAAVAGAVYIAATYGDKIVAWAKRTLHTCKCHDCVTYEDFADETVGEAEEAAADEEPVEESAEAAEEAAPEEEIPADAVVAGEDDFEG